MILWTSNGRLQNAISGAQSCASPDMISAAHTRSQTASSEKCTTNSADSRIRRIQNSTAVPSPSPCFPRFHANNYDLILTNLQLRAFHFHDGLFVEHSYRAGILLLELLSDHLASRCQQAIFVGPGLAFEMNIFHNLKVLKLEEGRVSGSSDGTRSWGFVAYALGLASAH
jgi:hypothetical protein